TIVATGDMTAEIAQRAIGTKTVAMIMTAGAIGLNGVSMLSGATVVIMNGMKEDTEGKIIVRPGATANTSGAAVSACQLPTMRRRGFGDGAVQLGHCLPCKVSWSERQEPSLQRQDSNIDLRAHNGARGYPFEPA